MASLLALDSISAYGSDFYNLYVPFKSDFRGFDGVLSGGSEQQPQSLVLDGEKGELAKVRVGKKGASQEKALVALKNHCEAERRRRERINAHLATLRGLVPSTDKMDKSTLLAAVIAQVKELKKTAKEASKGFLVPTDADEVRIEPFDSGAGDGTLYFRASLCCDYRPELLTDIKQAFDALKLKLIKAEVSTLGRRVKNEFVLSAYEERLSENVVSGARQLLAASIHQSLTSVLDMSGTLEYSPRTAFPNKKRRISFDSSSSSS